MENLIRNSITSDDDLRKAGQRLNIDIGIVWLRDYRHWMEDYPTIINLGSSISGGTHWIAIYKEHYFDSFGMPPPHWQGLERKEWTDLQIQSIEQGYCGAYCILFLYHAINNSLPEFYSEFNPLNIT